MHVQVPKERERPHKRRRKAEINPGQGVGARLEQAEDGSNNTKDTSGAWDEHGVGGAR